MNASIDEYRSALETEDIENQDFTGDIVVNGGKIVANDYYLVYANAVTFNNVEVITNFIVMSAYEFLMNNSSLTLADDTSMDLGITNNGIIKNSTLVGDIAIYCTPDYVDEICDLEIIDSILNITSIMAKGTLTFNGKSNVTLNASDDYAISGLRAAIIMSLSSSDYYGISRQSDALLEGKVIFNLSEGGIVSATVSDGVSPAIFIEDIVLNDNNVITTPEKGKIYTYDDGGTFKSIRTSADEYATTVVVKGVAPTTTTNNGVGTGDTSDTSGLVILLMLSLGTITLVKRKRV